MPDGRLYHRTFVHHHGHGFTYMALCDGMAAVEGGPPLLPCLHQSRPLRAHQPPMDLGTPLQQAQYYSDWSVYAQTTSPTLSPFTGMVSTWQVPLPPASRGPADQSSVYLFNGLEDGGGHHGNSTLILQPVLQFGKSGCLLDPADWGHWNVGAYLVDGNGRAHCGKTHRVQPGDTVVGSMVASRNNSWTVTARSSDGTESAYTASLGTGVTIDAAYLTLEGMVIYSCQAYPPGGGMVFSNVTLHDAHGQITQPLWTPEVRHSDCGQSVSNLCGTPASCSVKLAWESK
eukprot:gene3184-3708_t